MLGSVRQVNWKRIGEVHIKLFVIPLNNAGKGSVHSSAEASVYMVVFKRYIQF
jgi:hypothetical protein